MQEETLDEMLSAEAVVEKGWADTKTRLCSQNIEIRISRSRGKRYEIPFYTCN